MKNWTEDGPKRESMSRKGSLRKRRPKNDRKKNHRR